MKKISLILFASAATVLAMVSCSKEIESYEVNGAATGTERTVSFVATSIDAKTAFGTPEGTSVPTLWTANDSKIKVSLNLGTPVDADVTPAIDGKSAQFTATVTDDASGSYVFSAISPATAYKAVNATEKTVSYVVPSIQTPLDASVDESAQVLLGASTSFAEFPESVALSFTHATAYGKLTLSGLSLASEEKVSSITIFSEVGVTGTVVLDLTTMGVKTAPATKSIKLLTSKTSDVWFACAPAEVAGTNLTIYVGTNKGTYMKQVSVPAGKNFVAGKIASINVNMAGVAASTTDAILVAAGKTLSDYTKFDFDVFKGYYNSNTTNYPQLKNSDATAESFSTTKWFTKASFPKGTVIVINDGFKYRPEAFYGVYNATANKNNGANFPRPSEVLSNTASQVVVLDDEWWLRGLNSASAKRYYSFRAFNIASLAGVAMTADERALSSSALGIYIPKEKVSTDAIFTAAGYNLANYTKLEFTNYYTAAQYESTKNAMSTRTSQAAGKKCYLCTNTLAKSSIPNGSVIVAKEYINYRAHGWENDTDPGSTNPAEVSGASGPSVTVVDDTWHSTFNYRAFTIRLTGAFTQWQSGSPLFGATIDQTGFNYLWEEIENGFAIYVPND